jgi:hypothetical protein
MQPSKQATKIPIELGDQYEWVREFAHRQRLSMAEVVREAIRRYRMEVDPQLPLPMPRRSSQ